MAVKVVIPIVGKMGGKYDIVKLVEWKVKEGDQIQQGDIVLAVETEKASCDIEADASGFLYVLVVEGEKAIPMASRFAWKMVKQVESRVLRHKV